MLSWSRWIIATTILFLSYFLFASWVWRFLIVDHWTVWQHSLLFGSPAYKRIFQDTQKHVLSGCCNFCVVGVLAFSYSRGRVLVVGAVTT